MGNGVKSHEGPINKPIEDDLTGNAKYSRNIMIQKIRIKKLLREGKTPTYYTNFVVINGETFNGISRDTIRALMREVAEEQKRKEMKEFRAKLNEDWSE